ncbi:exported hypothetical protein [Actinacidiphila bryophytorum]|uniref:Uncharacterized protein n=1 Tax=Actinacidiphila bryophytorum TaxID=1436133 RepID=A0A9W4E8F5_9ACTN|nr:exported hypothetical protein [Actinacidiphila bryophytorum]
MRPSPSSRACRPCGPASATASTSCPWATPSSRSTPAAPPAPPAASRRGYARDCPLRCAIAFPPAGGAQVIATCGGVACFPPATTAGESTTHRSRQAVHRREDRAGLQLDLVENRHPPGVERRHKLSRAGVKAPLQPGAQPPRLGSRIPVPERLLVEQPQKHARRPQRYPP